jgi:hypothetical protein
MEIPTKLKKEIDEFCKANSIEDIDQFIIKVLRRGFSIEKFGISPVLDQLAENLGENIDSLKVQIIPKVAVQRIDVDFEIRPTDPATERIKDLVKRVEDKKDLYGE